ncbi:hypothetical protein LshimejAT787_1105380 [Lyophyllum shimeji]|uniref:Uncharacterized protein n=1 Tax=Lyophyllum shimeji TaxID=47721 RepID=A0A9P3PUZ7_LYOSH|nr:hypothetical protein LshimejAT787_1105380 [Lyophyllum shimeji]
MQCTSRCVSRSFTSLRYKAARHELPVQKAWSSFQTEPVAVSRSASALSCSLKCLAMKALRDDVLRTQRADDTSTYESTGGAELHKDDGDEGLPNCAGCPLYNMNMIHVATLSLPQRERHSKLSHGSTSMTSG